MDKPVTLIGTSGAMRAIDEEILYAVRSDAKVLITGESGVGKEVVARAIHQRSNRAGQPFITINCAGFPDALLESELFGHVKGSFTDAYRDKRGWFELAHRGTIFMDEVGEMSLRMQALLLRFLESGEAPRVGADQPAPVLNVRIVAATNSPLIDRVADGSFREDLYYRLNVIHIEVPPLRERRDDIEALVGHFVRGLSAAHARRVPDLSPAALRLLMEYDWPGNVRELRNIVERVVVRTRTDVIEPADLPSEIRALGARAAKTSTAAAAEAAAERLFERMVRGGEPFWSVVYEPFIARDLTRDQVRRIVNLGLAYTRGNYKDLAQHFNLTAAEYKRFVGFLRKYQCHVPSERFRAASARDAEDHRASA